MIVLHLQPHPTLGRLGDRFIYGIASFRAMSDVTSLVIRDCAAAAWAADASDKFFLQRIGQVNVGAKEELDREMPALQVVAHEAASLRYVSIVCALRLQCPLCQRL